MLFACQMAKGRCTLYIAMGQRSPEAVSNRDASAVGSCEQMLDETDVWKQAGTALNCGFLVSLELRHLDAI